MKPFMCFRRRLILYVLAITLFVAGVERVKDGYERTEEITTSFVLIDFARERFVLEGLVINGPLIVRGGSTNTLTGFTRGTFRDLEIRRLPMRLPTGEYHGLNVWLTPTFIPGLDLNFTAEAQRPQSKDDL